MYSITLKICFLLCIMSCFSLRAHLLKIIEQHSHRKDCYTQGLFFLNDTHLFESCGLYNKSFFHLMKYSSDPFILEEVYVTQIPWKSSIFLEGATIFKGFIYILTWRERVVYKLDSTNFSLISELQWKKQGWGLTNNATHMFVSDGSDRIYVVDEEFKVIEQKMIKTFSGGRAFNLNELQFHNGYIYANIYFDRFIHKINYEAGKVIEKYDGLSLIQAENKVNNPKSDEVFNGIAYSKLSKKFLATGKDWSQIFEVEL